MTRCDSEHIGSQGGCYFTLQSHSPPVPQDILIWSPDPRRRDHSITLLRGKQETGTELRHNILFLDFSDLLYGWVLIASPKRLFLVLLQLASYAGYARCNVNEQIRIEKPLRKVCNAYMCDCKRTALLLIGLDRERDIHPFSLSPPSLVRGCIIDREQLHFLSVSKLIRCCAFVQPVLIPFPSSFLWNPHFPPIYLCLSSSSTKFLLCLCHVNVFSIHLCIFHQSVLSYLNWHPFQLSPSPLSSRWLFYPLSLPAGVFYYCDYQLCQSLHLQLKLKLNCKWFWIVGVSNCH